MKNRVIGIKEIIIIFVFLTFTFVSCSEGNKVPLKGSSINIDDGEYLFYKGYISGENVYNWTLVSRYENDPKWGRIINVFENIEYLSYGEKKITDYKNFPDWYKISLTLYSSVAMHKNFHYLETNNSYKGPLSMDYLYDDQSSEIFYTEVDRVNGAEATSKSRIPIKKGYPFGDSSSTIFLPRFLDMTVNGEGYIFIPLMIKEPVPFTVHILGRETITTPAGTFKTLKVTSEITDPFLSKLLGQLTRNSLFWIEDGPARRIIKEKTTSVELVLTAVSNVIK